MEFIALDIRTLSFVTTSISVVFAIGLAVFGFQQEKDRGFSLLATAAAMYALGHFLLGYRGILPEFITIILANLMIIMGIVFYLEGTRRFLGRTNTAHPISIIAIGAGIVLFLYFTYQVPSVKSRIITIVSIHVVVSAFAAWELLFHTDRHGIWQIPDVATAMIFAGYCLFQTFRLVWTLSEDSIQSFMSAGNVHALAFISVIILISGSTFGYIWMVSKRYEHELVEIAIRDPLTQVLNRRGLEEFAVREFAKMNRGLSEIVTVLIDIDDFKDINDQLGHDSGDKVIVRVADLLQSNIRTFDILGRIGGDEFIMLLPNTQLDEALVIAERLRMKIESLQIDLKGTQQQITASFGVAKTTSQPKNLDELIPSADQAMYRAKHEGKNRVTCL